MARQLNAKGQSFSSDIECFLRPQQSIFKVIADKKSLQEKNLA
jgi:hypothetical protein